MEKLYIGIDLHKSIQVWVGLAEAGNDKLFTQTFPVTPEAVNQAVTLAGKKGHRLIAAVEPVCGWIWVVKQLRHLGVEVHIVNPRKIRMIADSLKKTDEGDAYTLARLLRTGDIYESNECDETTRKHRSLVRQRCFLVCMRASIKCRLESVITREGSHLVDGTPSSKKRTDAIVAGTNTEWNMHIRAIDGLGSLITELDTEMAELAKTNTTVQRLMTIPGVGIVTATVMYAEIGDFSNFKKPESLAAFAGLVPRERSSGGKQKLGGLTRTGSKYLRYVMFETAMRIRDTDKTSALYAFYNRIKGGKTSNAMKARAALARKLLTIAWYMMKHEQAYAPQ
jgi:transposase